MNIALKLPSFVKNFSDKAQTTIAVNQADVYSRDKLNWNSLPDIVIFALILYCVYQSAPDALDLAKFAIELCKNALQGSYSGLGSF